MRNDYESGRTGAAVMDKPSTAEDASEKIRRSSRTMVTRRDLPADFADEDEDTAAFLRDTGRARRMRAANLSRLLFRTRSGRVVAGVVAVLLVAGIGLGAAAADRFLQSDPRFRVPSADAIEMEGNRNVRRAEVLALFREDVGRNIFHVPMAKRRAQVEGIPWVQHATVLRLLPNRLRVSVTERTPVAFTREGNSIGMVDAEGVALSMPGDAAGNPNYSFPVVTGFAADDSAKERAERMALYTTFVHELDGGGEKISRDLSEVDLSDTEDVKALIPDHNSEVLVHFGADDFLNRYHRFKEHIDEWRAQYPHLSSVDMRYTEQVVLRSSDAPVAQPAGTLPTTPSAQTSAPAPPQTTVPAPPAHTTAHAPATHAKPAHTAETRRKVDAIKAWMARREQARKAHTANANGAD